MKAIIIQGLIDFLNCDIDLQKAFYKQFKKLDIQFYKRTIQAFISELILNGTLKYYLLDKKYLDIAWLNLGGTLFNLDSLYTDYEYAIADWIMQKEIAE
jgi:hypothetical protein